jgi:glucose/arabinose dehydrogenase
MLQSVHEVANRATPQHPTSRLMLAAAAIVAVCALGGCRSGEPTVVAPKSNSAQTTTSAPTSTPTTSAPRLLSALNLELSPVVTQGLDNPLFVTHAGDGSGRLFVVEQTGQIRVIDNGALLDKPFLDVAQRISYGGERGLLGLAFSPDFENSGRFYLDYTDVHGNTTIARYTADDPTSDAPGFSAPEIILTVQQPYANHNGGMVVFGPDKMLYIGMGDGGSAGDPQNRAQNLQELLGKLLRLDVEGPAARSSASAPTYDIPRDNPFQFPGSTPSDSRLIHRPEIWAWGLRNPWRFSFDRATGDLWIGDVGQSDWEEIDFAPSGTGAGINWGWHLYEGTHPYPPGSAPAPKAGLEFPIVEYDHSTGSSITGGYVYRGSKYPDLRGVYLYGDFENGKIWGLRRTDTGGAALSVPTNRLLLNSGLMLASFGEDEDGELYAVDLGGGVYRIGVK